MTPDSELLRQFAKTNSEDAFAELVKRHVPLVYSAALRQVNGDAHLAQDVAQTVFTDLARKAGPLARRESLTGWLYTSAHFAAAKLVRGETRRRDREEKFMREPTETAPDASRAEAFAEAGADWEKLRPVLDSAMHELKETDREAVLLRYFENRPFAEVGVKLGLNENAARMRVERALEKLRAVFARRGVAATATLAAVISANAVQTAPVGLAATLSTAAVLAGTAVSTSTIIAATKTIAMTTLQKTFVTVIVAALAGAGIYEARQAAQLRDQVQTLQQQQTPLAEQLRQLQHERDDATNRMAELLAENSRLKSNPNQSELLKLRNTVTLLKNSANDPVDIAAKDLVARVNTLKQRLEQTPKANIPELQLLNEQDWLTACRGWNLDSENGVRNALSGLRGIAEQKFASMAGRALAKYSQANDKQFPTDLSQLQSYFDSPVDAAILERWKILPTGATIPGIGNVGPFITQKAPVDELLDRQFAIGLNGFSCTDFLTSEIQDVMMPVYRAYAAANNGLSHDDPSQLLPYATTPEQQAAVHKLIQQSAAGK